MSSVNSLTKLVATLSDPTNGNSPHSPTRALDTQNSDDQDRHPASNDLLESSDVTLVTVNCVEDDGNQNRVTLRGIDRNKWKRNNKQKSNDLERVRRERIAHKIKNLGALIPVSDALKKNKESILEQTVVYISDLQDRLKCMLSPEGSAAQVKLVQELQLQVDELKEEKKCYQAILESHGIPTVVNPTEFWRRIGMPQSSGQQHVPSHTLTSNNDSSVDTQSNIESRELNSSPNYTTPSCTSTVTSSTGSSRPTISSMNSVTEVTSISCLESNNFLKTLESLSLTNITTVKQTACCKLTWSLPNVTAGFLIGNTGDLAKSSNTLVDIHNHTISLDPVNVISNSENDDRLTGGERLKYRYVKPSNLKVLSSVNHSSSNLGRTASSASCSVKNMSSSPPFSVVSLLSEPLKSIKRKTNPAIPINNLFLTAKASDKGNAFKAVLAQFPKSNTAFLHSANSNRSLVGKPVLPNPSRSVSSTQTVTDNFNNLKMWLNSEEHQEELGTELSDNDKSKSNLYTTSTDQTFIEPSVSSGNELIHRKPATSHTTLFDIASLVQEKDNPKEIDVTKHPLTRIISQSNRNEMNQSTEPAKSIAATSAFWSTGIASTSAQSEQRSSLFATLSSASIPNCAPVSGVDIKGTNKPVQTNMLLIADILDKKSDLVNDHVSCQIPSNSQMSLFIPEQSQIHSYNIPEPKSRTGEYLINKHPSLNTPAADVTGFGTDLESSHSVWQPVIPGTACSEYGGHIPEVPTSLYQTTGSKTGNAISTISTITTPWNENFLISGNSNPFQTNNQCMFRETVATNLSNTQADTQGLQRKRKVERKAAIQKRTKVQEKYLNTSLLSVPNLLTSNQLASWNSPNCNQHPVTETGNPNMVKNYRNLWLNVEMVEESRLNYTDAIRSSSNSLTSLRHDKVDGSTSGVPNIIHRNKTRTLPSHGDQSNLANHTYLMNRIVNSEHRAEQPDYSTSTKRPKVHPSSFPYSGILYDNTAAPSNIYMNTTFATTQPTASLKHWQQQPDPRHQKDLWNVPPCHDATQAKSQFIHAGARCISNVSLPQSAQTTNSYHALQNHPTYPPFSQHACDFDKTIYSSYATSIMTSSCFTPLGKVPFVSRAPTKNLNNNNSTCATGSPYGQGSSVPVFHGMGLQQKGRNEKKVLQHQISQILGDTVPAQSQPMHFKSQHAHSNS